jgi:tyrosine-protein kinase Etk/Wzc
MKKSNIHKLNTEESLFISAIKNCIKQWPAFLIFLTLLCIGCFVYLKITPEYYQANAILIIKDEKKGNEESKLMESLNLISAKKIIENEVQVLQSRAIIDKVVQALYFNAPIYVKNSLNKKRAFLNSPIFIQVQSPETIPGGLDVIRFVYDSNTQKVTLNEQIERPLNQWVNTPFGTLKFIKNPNFSSTNEDFYFELVNNESAANRFTDLLKVTATNKLSSVINLQFRDGDPKLAEAALNELINTYNQMILTEKKELAKNTLRFIDIRLNLIGNQLDSIEREIRQFKGSRDAVDISTQGQLFLQNVSLNDQRLSDIDLKLSVIDELDQKMTNKEHNLLIMPTTMGVLDPTLTQLITTLNEYELQHDKIKNTTALNNPLMISISDQINATKERIKENMTAYRSSLEKSRNSYIDNNERFTNMLQSIPAKEQGLLEISRDKNIKSDIYAFLLQKREESEIAYASTITDNSIITNAHASSSPVSPNHLFVFGSALFLLFGFPIGMVSLKDSFSGAIRFRKDIEGATNLPIIGEIAHAEWKEHKMLQYGEQTKQYESFRKIRYALDNRRMGTRNKKLLITSGISGEGKSYIATNLALSFADVGKRVVLIDCDFKQAHLSKSFNFSKSEGITDYLSGLVTEKDIIHKIPDYKNMFFIPVGSIQQNTTALLENGSIRDLFDYLEDHFDLVIIDTAPLMNVADAYLLANYCDTTLFVVKHGYSPKNILEFISENDEINASSDTMILYNGVEGQHNYISSKRLLSYNKSKATLNKGNVKLLN